MSTTESNTTGDDQGRGPLERWQVPDPFLVLVVGLLEADELNDLRIGITLFVHGLVVSGKLVSRKVYREGMAATLKASGEIAEVLGKQLEAAIVELDELGRGALATASEVCLENARVFAPGQPPFPSRTNEVWWRGRIASIDAFFFGELAVS